MTDWRYRMLGEADDAPEEPPDDETTAERTAREAFAAMRAVLREAKTRTKFDPPKGPTAA
jgi:heme oxygenase